jgi:DHA2 family multidrug resistance protein
MPMSTATLISAKTASGTPQISPWLIGVMGFLVAFMEVLGTSIANVALPHIAGSMGASNDESMWVLTSYLVSSAIVLPINGFLVSLPGRKRFFLMCIAFFTVSSFLCRVAPTLGLLLLFRVLQGAFGGGLQPMTQAILADTSPPAKEGVGLCFVWGHSALRPRDRPHARGMAYRQLLLAVDFLALRSRSTSAHPYCALLVGSRGSIGQFKEKH